MYKKKTSPAPVPTSSRAPYIASACTLLILLLAEYLFMVPSKWIHGIPEMPMKDIFPGKEVCSAEYAPVCGKDGRTYSNSCLLKSAGTTAAKVGKCDTDPETPTEESIGIPISVEAPPLSLEEIQREASLEAMDLSKYQVYTNTNFRYSLALPKWAYYQGSAGPERKSHRLAIGLSASGAEAFSTALIRVVYYPSGDPILEGVQQTLTLDRGVMTISYEGTLSMKGEDILKAIEATAKSLE